jgi:hypothetical protein
VLASLSVVAGCTKDLGVESTKFRCGLDADCEDGWFCDPVLRICSMAVYDGGVAVDSGIAPMCGFDADFAFNYDMTSWQANGWAMFILNLVRLTPAVTNKTGTLWYTTKFPARKFSYQMEFSIGGGSGGDGMAMAWITGTSTSIGEGSASLGVAGLVGYYLEIDTHKNTWDPPEEHVSLIRTDGMPQPNVKIIKTSTTIGEVRNNGAHIIELDFDLGRADVLLGGKHILTATVVGYQPFTATFGVGAATGESHDVHDVHRLALHCE